MQSKRLLLSVALAVTAMVFGARSVVAQADAPTSTQTATWSPQPWLDDLQQIQQTMNSKYANLQWLTETRQVNVAGLFTDAETRLRSAGNDAEARAVFDRLLRKIDDGHVVIDWPHPNAPSPMATSGEPTEDDFCRALGYATKPGVINVAAGLKGYRALDADPTFPAGLVTVAGRQIGVVRLEVFMPEHSPALCRDAVRKLKPSLAAPCSARCQDGIGNLAYAAMTTLLEDRIGALKAAGASVLIVDITNNGGGSEWAEAVARMLSSRELVSEHQGFVRGPLWANHWADVSKQLRAFAPRAKPQDRRTLMAWSAQADRAQRQAEQQCPASGNCEWLGRAGYATGLVGSAGASAFSGKPWGPAVFTPAEFLYHDGVWSGPLLILVDQGTFSAAEEFASVLQDNRLAFIAGARTGGAGCGHTDGGSSTVLTHSGATFEVPDCARFRRDGSNEVNGVIPDYLIPWRADNGALFKAHLLENALPQILRQMQTHRDHAERKS